MTPCVNGTTCSTILSMGHKVNLPSGKLVVRLQPTLHAELKQIAELEESTLNSIIQAMLHRGVEEWLIRRKHATQG